MKGSYIMKIKNIKDVNKFLEVVLDCKGKVEIVTPEGDNLNLKSKLRQYVALSEMFSEAKIDDIEIVVHEPEDEELLLEYLVES
jgi:hypothetical protein